MQPHGQARRARTAAVGLCATAVCVLASPALALEASPIPSQAPGEIAPPGDSPSPSPSPPTPSPPTPSPPTPSPYVSASPDPDPPPTDPLTVADDSVTTRVGQAAEIDIGVNDAVLQGLAVSTVVTSQPTHGSAELSGSLLTYTPREGFVGDDVLVYTTCVDAEETCLSASVYVTVEAVETAASEVAAPPASADNGSVLPNSCGSEHSWGGWPNGQIPQELLAPIGGGQTLEPNAAAAFLAMRDAAAAAGVTIGVTDSYRSYEAQVEVRARKGGQVATATPGTSIHGWGRALDLNVNAQVVLSWLKANGPRFGWVNPAWAQRPGKGFEPWHWEYQGTAATGGGGGGGCAVATSAGPVTGTVIPPGATEPPVLSLPGPGPGQGMRIAAVTFILLAWQIAIAMGIRAWLRRS